ncbi:MAG: Rho termination factor N-terminal domain-containing protein [Cyanobium sp.]
MTLRQLRHIASELGVTLYSRKTKEELMEAISNRQDDPSFSLAALEAEMVPAPRLSTRSSWPKPNAAASTSNPASANWPRRAGSPSMKPPSPSTSSGWASFSGP